MNFSYLNRRYPHAELTAHIVGYVGRVDEQDLKQLGEANSALTHVGKTGIERYYDDILRGQVGYERVETNVEGLIANGVIIEEMSTRGSDDTVNSLRILREAR